MTEPRVFISYSHDTVEHQERVLKLADRLRADGIDAEIDQYNAAPPEGWPLWCEREIEAADIVLMVCSETYNRRVSGDEGRGKGLGVVWEARIIRQLLYDTSAVSDKFVPVLFSDTSPEQIPKPIKDKTYYVIDTDDGYEELYRRLAGRGRPALGTMRLPARSKKWAEVAAAPAPSSNLAINLKKVTTSPAATEKHDLSPPVRGALKLEVSTSTPVVSAGKEFSIYVVIRNPFPVPVTIYSTETHIPVELSDELWRKQDDTRMSKAHQERVRGTHGQLARMWIHLQYLFVSLKRNLRRDEGPRVAVAVSPQVYDELTRIAKSVYIGGNLSGGLIDMTETWNLSFPNLSNEQIRTALWDINEYRQGRAPVILNSGDSVVQHFILRTTGWLMFAPIGHTFQIQVRFGVDNANHIDTVPFSLSIRSSLGSSIIGSVFGSMLGFVVKTGSEYSSMADLVYRMAITMIFAVVIIVAFARKSAVQSIVSVEDFWGGVFIGFLVGYSGEAFFGSILRGGEPSP